MLQVTRDSTVMYVRYACTCTSTYGLQYGGYSTQSVLYIIAYGEGCNVLQGVHVCTVQYFAVVACLVALLLY